MGLSIAEYIEIRKKMVEDKKIFEFLPFKNKVTLKKWRERIFREFDSEEVMQVVVKVDSKNYLYHMDNFPMYVMMLSTKDEQKRLKK